MKKSKLVGLLATAAICTFVYTAPSQAAVIDFTSSDWDVAVGSGNSSASFDGVSISSTGGTLTQGSEGIGVNGLIGDDGEIGYIGLGYSETVTVDFGGLVNVTNVYLRNLFADEVLLDLGFFKIYHDETALVNGVDYTGIDEVEGLLTIALNSTFSSLTFSASGAGSDYSLVGLDVSAVPLPAAAYLFGSGLLGLFGVRRRTAKKAA